MAGLLIILSRFYLRVKNLIDNLLIQMNEYLSHRKIEDYLIQKSSKQDECPIARDLLSSFVGVKLEGLALKIFTIFDVPLNIRNLGHGTKFERISSNFNFEWTKFEFSKNRNKFESLCSNFELSINRASDISPFHLLPHRPFGAAYVPILLSEVEQEQRPSGNEDREAIVV